MIRKYPIGMQSFRAIREGGYVYVDKTEIVHRLVDTGKYYFLSRPRRFGKSLLVDTIEELFKGSKELFEGLWIEDPWDWSQTNPVIHFNFAEIPYRQLGLEEALEIELERNAGFAGVSLETNSLQGKFRELIEKVDGAAGNVVILIDEYDKPLIDFLNDPKELEANRLVMKTFYSVLKGQDAHIRFLLLTGVSRFAKVSLFSDLNHLEDITLGRQFNELVGITQRELERDFAPEIADMQQEQSDILATIRQWYNGYSWSGQGETLYNPFSLLNLMKSREFRNFWFETGTPAFFADMIQRNPRLKFPDGEVESGPEVLIDLFNRKTAYSGPDDIRPVTILFQTGYLTVKGYDIQRRTYTLDYPNLEVRESMQVFLLEAYTHLETEAVRPTVLDIGDAFQANDIPQVMKHIDALFVNIPSTLWAGARENFFHAIIQTAFGLLDILMESGRNYAGTRPDITVFTKTHIYVLEFKRVGTVEEALAQDLSRTGFGILTKDYFRPFQLDKRRKVAIGIKFDVDKKAVAEYRVQELD